MNGRYIHDGSASYNGEPMYVNESYASAKIRFGGSAWEMVEDGALSSPWYYGELPTTIDPSRYWLTDYAEASPAGTVSINSDENSSSSSSSSSL